MRAALFIALALGTVLAASLAASGVQASEKRYCIIPGGTAEGSGPDCRFDTLEQCRASRDGTQYCSENPYYHAAAPAKRHRSRRE